MWFRLLGSSTLLLVTVKGAVPLAAKARMGMFPAYGRVRLGEIVAV